jgi:intracellular sulfur oxidation DsrE/DsrF family protein
VKRTSFLTASAALLAASAGAARAQAATAVPGGTQLVERAADFDAGRFAQIVGKPARIRQLYESVAFKPVIFNNIKNSFNGLQFGFGYPADRIAIVMANHGPSAVYGYSDYLWRKYRLGEFFKLKDADGATVTSNVFLPKHAAVDPGTDPDDEGGMYQDRSIEMLQQRGLVMLACHTAAEEQARMLVKKGFAPAGMTATQVADDILTHLIPGAVVVPSMVATIAVLQAKFHYTYISPSF